MIAEFFTRRDQESALIETYARLMRIQPGFFGI